MGVGEPGLWSATELAAAIRSGELGSEELLDHFVARIEAINPSLNAVITLDVDRARSAARAADARTASGAELPPLHGLPVTIKDALCTAGLRSTGGAEELADHVPSSDAPAVAALRAAGAVVFGKTNLPRWSGDIQSFNTMFGTTNNPWDLARTPGGSSGGAAAAVAAGLTSFELGTDIGGSIRVPAAFCGIFGHKPSHGLIPSTGYLDEPRGGTIEADVNVLGPLARSAADLDLLVGVMAGPGPDRAVAWRVQLPPPRHQKLTEFRVAAWLDDPAFAIDAELGAALERAVAELEAAGCRIDRSARPALDLQEAADLGRSLIAVATMLGVTDADFAALVARSDDTSLTATARQRVDSLTLRHRDWLARHRRRTELRAVWADFFTHYDVLVCPVTLVPPFPHHQEGDFGSRTIDVNGVTRPYWDLIGWTGAIGGAYLPVSVPPLARTEAGLPVGIQVVGPYLEDRTTIAFAGLFADVAGGFEPPPVAKSPAA